MRKAVWLAAALAFPALPALAQNFIGEDPATLNADSVTEEVQVYLKPSPGQNPTAAAFAKTLFNELERSRQLDGVEVVGATTLQIQAPLEMAVSADGRKLVMSYEMIPPRGEPSFYRTSCQANRMEDCAEAIVLRAERLARDAAALRR